VGEVGSGRHLAHPLRVFALSGARADRVTPTSGCAARNSTRRRASP